MGVFTQRLSGGANNGYYAGEWFSDSSSCSVGIAYLGTVVKSAFRFTNVSIPQGATISLATLTLTASSTDTDTIGAIVFCIDEDNTADFSSDPTTRTTTTTSHDLSVSGISADEEKVITVTEAVQEVIDRVGWSSGNALGFMTSDDTTSNDNIIGFYGYSGSTTKCAYLSITYVGVSASASLSPSASASASASKSASSSGSASASPSQSFIEPFFGMKIAKPDINVLNTQEPFNLIFSSDYGTLKYYTKETATVEFDAGAGSIAGTTTITHDLGYYPYVEVFVSVHIGASTGVYEYCPFFGAGATVFYSANYKITSTTIELYGQIDGVSSSVWTFDFLVFVFKNDLGLS